MKLSATEKRIYALAQKWAKAKNPAPPARDGRGDMVQWYTADYWKWKHNKACGRALLKLLEEKR